ncbi:MAG: hypothetical protein RMY28_009340 [Nostoc sp. ChiSLP01]|nr:hypothetical protein [Nostoc sp. CmiSLP01]MDZ8285241.1 hypothetical protein [Nostoc sp. ChiSLP01]
MIITGNQFTTLSDRQLDMAFSIAQYDVKAAYRYCLIIDSKNQMKCPFCGKEFVNSYDQQDGSMAFVCLTCTPRKNQVLKLSKQSLFEKRVNAANNCLEIKLNPADYYSVCNGKSIRIDANIASSQAKKFKVINKATGSHVMRTLVVLGSGNRGYWI